MSAPSLLVPRDPSPDDEPPADDQPDDSPSPDDEGEEETGEEAPAGPPLSPPELLPFDELHSSVISPPRDKWLPIFRAHRRNSLRPASRYETLWQESQGRRDEIWAAARGVIYDSVNRDPTTRAPDRPADPTSFADALRDSGSQRKREEVMSWLQGLFAKDPVEFGLWVTRLVSTTNAQDTLGGAAEPEDTGLLYEFVLEELQRQDRKWPTPQPLPSVRFASMLNSYLQERPFLSKTHPGLAGKHPDLFVVRWRRYFEQWMLYQRPSMPVFRLLLVPGRSKLDGTRLDDEAADAFSRARALSAVPTISDHLKACPPGMVVVVLVSGGMVRSQQAEAEFMGDVLRDGLTWGDRIPSNMVVVEDGLSRHTTNNLRAAAQLALRLGLSDFWVQSSEGHAASMGAGLLCRYRQEAAWGLSLPARHALSHIAPMVRRRSGEGTETLNGRERFSQLRPMVFVPAVGDALNP
jgi:hypothetical protein